MEFFDFTIRFDDAEHQLTAKNGLSIDEVSELLDSLSRALPKDSNKLVLSEIRGNCYAMQLSTLSYVTLETLKVIHKKIEENDTSGLNYDQKSYVNKIGSLIAKNGYNLSAYTSDKQFHVSIDKVDTLETPPYYYEYGTITGILTSIGGKTIDGSSNITVDTAYFPIKVTSEQEKKLINYFKSNPLRLTLIQKIKFENDKIVSAELEEFEVISGKSLIEIISEANDGDGLFNDIDDSVEAIRSIRK